MGISPFCQIYPPVYISDIADTIAKETESIGGLAGSGWAKTFKGVGGPLNPHLCFTQGALPGG
eukprot:1161293-Pelagomonas_calceolata.AAC.8